MPELPEVETIRRGLVSKIINVPLKSVEIRLPKIVRGPASELQQLLEGNTFESIDRRGKLLIFWLGGAEQALLIHLKMTGQLIYRHQQEQIAGGHPWPAFEGELPNKYSHVIIEFADTARLFFNDLRQFGYLQLATRAEVEIITSQYGLEPGMSDFTQDNFLAVLNRKRGRLKAVLLDQKIFSGLGNIYVDESCYWAEILPTRTVESLTDSEKVRLYLAIVQVIEQAILHRGTTVHDFVDAEGNRGNYSDKLEVYGRAGQTCRRCGATIQKIKFAGRGTHFCPGCQL